MAGWMAGAMVAGSVASAYMQSRGAERGAAKIENAMKESIRFQEKMYKAGVEFLAPYRDVGLEGLRALAQRVEAGPGEFTEDPGYQFRMQEGMNALARSASARGQLLSGEQLKGVTRYGQDYATGEYQNFLNRYYQSLVPYAGLAEMGQQAASQITSGGMATGANVANTLASLAPAQAQYTMGQYTPWAQMAGTLGQNAMNALSIYGQQQPVMQQQNALSQYTPGMGYARQPGQTYR